MAEFRGQKPVAKTSMSKTTDKGFCCTVRYCAVQLDLEVIIMSQTQSTRSERVEARIAPGVLAIVRRAAEVQGSSLSEFIVQAANQAAQRTIEDLQAVRLSTEDQIRFVESLLNEDAEPAPALRRAAKHHANLFGKP